MSAPSAASPAASADAAARPAALAGGPLRRMAEGTLAMSLTEWRKLRHNQLDLLTRSVQPLLWLFVFGTAMSRLRSIPTGGIEYRAYLAPGIMAQAAMFIAIFFGLAVIWERDVGQLQRLLATPLPRSAIVLGKAAGAATRALVQAVLLLVVVADRRDRAALDGGRRARRAGAAGGRDGRVRVPVDDDRVLVKERERFMGIGQLVMMPLFFASSALYPLAIMPGWLKAIAHVNPLTYEVEGLRAFLLGGGHPWLDLLVCVGWLGVFAVVATGAYPRALL